MIKELNSFLDSLFVCWYFKMEGFDGELPVDICDLIIKFYAIIDLKLKISFAAQKQYVYDENNEPKHW